MLFVAVILSTIGLSYCSTIVLDPTVTSSIDIETRRELLIKILGKINDTVNAYRSEIQGCEQQINNTIDECNACRQNLCVPKPGLDEQIVQVLSAGVNKPVVFAGKVIDDAGNWFKNSGDWMGQRAVAYSKTVGSVANNVGDQLSKTGNSIFNNMVTGFNTLGNEFDKLGGTLENAFKNPLGGFLNLGSSISNLDDYLKNALGNVENSLNGFVSTLSGFGNDIGKFFAGLGRRKRSIVLLLRNRRCVNSCPVCDKLDTTKFTTEQITENVCGAASVNSQNVAILDVQWLQETYNHTVKVDTVVVTKVEFDPTIMNFDGGLPKFTVSYFTTVATGRKALGIPLETSNKDKMGIQIAEQYFPVIWAARGQ